jgi:hypothetical protein
MSEHERCRRLMVWFRCAGFVAAFAAVAAPAAAQVQPRGEVSAGYTLLNDFDFGQFYPTGWNGSAALNLKRWFSLVADAGGNYASDDGYSTREHAVAGGVRLRYSWTAASIYLQLLGGVGTFGSNLGESLTGPAVQSGLGVDVSVSRRWAIRFETGGRVVTYESVASPYWRGAVGLVYRVGVE